MKIVREEPVPIGQRGKNKLIVEIDEDDSIVINEAINMLDQRGIYDKDDRVFVGRLNHVKEVSHKMWELLHPS